MTPERAEAPGGRPEAPKTLNDNRKSTPQAGYFQCLALLLESVFFGLDRRVRA